MAFLGCSAGLTPPEFERFDPRLGPPVASFPDVPAVVLLDRGELRLGIDPKLRNPLARLRRLRRVRILREPGATMEGQVEVALEPGARIHGFRVRGIWPDGRVEIRSDAVDVKSRDGLPAKAVRLDGLTPGTIVEAVYDLWLTDLRFVPPWQFQSRLPTVRSEYAVVVPKGFLVDLRFSEGGRFVERPPDRFETPEGTRFSWSLADIPPRFPERDMPSPELLSPRAHVAFRTARIGDREVPGLRTWDEVGVWLLGRQPRWSELSDETIAEAQRVSGEVGETERALRLLEVVARDLPDAEDPPPPLWRAPLPHPDAVLRSRRAHPTSRGLVLVALLRAAGLPALPALYAWRDEDVLLPDAPLVRSLDGIAAALPREEGLLVLDPSDLTVSDRVPPPRLQGQRIVLLRSDMAEVVKVPVSMPEDSLTEVLVTLELGPRGDAHGELEARLTGAEAGALRRALLKAPPDTYAERLGAFLLARGVRLTPVSISIADLGVLRRPLLVTGTVEARGLVSGTTDTESELFVPLEHLLGGVPDGIREVRRSPRLFSAPRAVDVRLTLSLPEGWSPVFLPPVETLSGPGIELELGARKETERRIGFIFKERRTSLELPESAHLDWHQHRLDRRASASRTFGVRRPAEGPWSIR